MILSKCTAEGNFVPQRRLFCGKCPAKTGKISSQFRPVWPLRWARGPKLPHSPAVTALLRLADFCGAPQRALAKPERCRPGRPVWPLRWGQRVKTPPVPCGDSPLALSRFLRRAAAGACKNRSAAPAAAPCFVHWTRSPPLPWTQKRKSQRSKAGKNNSSWPVETFRASNGERVFSDRPLPAAPILYAPAVRGRRASAASSIGHQRLQRAGGSGQGSSEK